tara:strand:+ start:1234 stop:2151 length:918 start_codon:yes stop_codon:yes gene_type:complete
MKKHVITYIAGVPNVKNLEKIEVLQRFAGGVLKCGDNGIASKQTSWTPSDLGVIQGFVHEASPKSKHLMLRKSVVEHQKRIGKNSLIIDSNLFLYADKLNPLHYLRYSLNGVFPTTGNYFDSIVDSNRWKQISTDYNISLKDWRTNGDHILICVQRNNGWSMQGKNVVKWLDSTVKQLRKYTDRPIVVRGHPGDKSAKQYLNIKSDQWKLSKNENLTDDFKNAWAVITYNSSPGVAAAIEGIPLFVTDPYPQVSQAHAVANLQLSQIENPKVFERLQWIEKICMSHWKFEELNNGSAWMHIRKYI